MALTTRTVLFCNALRCCNQIPRIRQLSSLSAERNTERAESEQDGKEDRKESHPKSRSKQKSKWRFTSEVEEAASSDKPPPFMLGFGKASTLSIPSHLEAAISEVQEKYTKGQHKNMREKAKHFINQLVCRKRPMEQDEIAHHSATLREHLLNKELSKLQAKGVEPSEEDMEIMNKRIREKVVHALRKHVYHQKAVPYDGQQALMYMDGLMRSNFQHLTTIFREIKLREPTYVPRTMLDYGSGLASAMWAANSVWPSSIYEFLNVDQSGDMHTLAQLLLQGGQEEGEPYFKQVYFRRFMPAAPGRRYSLAVCDLTLLDLPDMNCRLDALFNLWTKTEDFLIITEFGTQAGFQTILEARQFLLELHRNDKLQDAKQLEGHVFAPCPHNGACPKLNAAAICKFTQSPHPGPRTCYLVLRKGPRNSEKSFPRIVKGPHESQNTFSMDLCCPDGQIKNAAVAKKTTDKKIFNHMKKYRHGDVIPLQETTEDNT